MRRAVLALTTALALGGALTLAGCSSSDSGGSDGTPTVVTSTNVWGAVASAVAGDKASVTVLFNDPTGDPHEFEPSAADSAKVVDADVVLMNGGHYDEYMEKASQNSKGTVINAFDTMTSHHENTVPEAHGETNEHVFYNLPVVGQVATELADDLAQKDEANATTYRDNAKAFNEKIDALRGSLGEIKKAHNGTKVAQTEPLAAYLLSEAGLDDVAPEGFTAAVEEGQSPSAADRAAMEDLLRTRQVKAFVYNTQAVDAVTDALLSTAKSANVPVVKFTETLPEGQHSYTDWQQKQIAALSSALAA
ncbi:metal ABC transporter solute-binding protein, Zn/Mn family [Gordonia aichiensis]|uniref:metal ABC transporter solute-binding protein, Zn/Mn family n=1 Tax=Gordonia aichiensis TaxID=36820 RepID=UPI00058C69DA|nr:zinc ABC transporter substrate-binding protein [Gordonia aichiensis]